MIITVPELIKQVPRYETPLMHNREIVGYPYCIKTAVRLFGKEFISEHQGIYQLYYEHSIVYIGMSKNLRKRILYHINDKDKIFDAVLLFPMPDDTLEDILEIEAGMIKHYTPSLNTSYLCKN